MQLRNARLCLDCEEVHDAQQCPVCASETFAFITRWVPAPERRGRPRLAEPAQPDEFQAYRLMLDPSASSDSPWTARPRSWQTLAKRGALGLALFGIAGLLWRRSPPQASHRTDDAAA